MHFAHFAHVRTNPRQEPDEAPHSSAGPALFDPDTAAAARRRGAGGAAEQRRPRLAELRPAGPRGGEPGADPGPDRGLGPLRAGSGPVHQRPSRRSPGRRAAGRSVDGCRGGCPHPHRRPVRGHYGRDRHPAGAPRRGAAGRKGQHRPLGRPRRPGGHHAEHGHAGPVRRRQGPGVRPGLDGGGGRGERGLLHRDDQPKPGPGHHPHRRHGRRRAAGRRARLLPAAAAAPAADPRAGTRGDQHPGARPGGRVAGRRRRRDRRFGRRQGQRFQRRRPAAARCPRPRGHGLGRRAGPGAAARP